MCDSGFINVNVSVHLSCTLDTRRRRKSLCPRFHPRPCRHYHHERQRIFIQVSSPQLHLYLQTDADNQARTRQRIYILTATVFFLLILGLVFLLLHRTRRRARMFFLDDHDDMEMATALTYDVSIWHAMSLTCV